jgi:uncharacterized protein with gpF-like domain
LHSASHYAREKAITERFENDIQAWKYMATLDRRTCLVCGVDDGKVYPVGAPKPVLPRHWSCRCCYVPVPKDSDLIPDVEGSRPAVKHSARKVHHRDGSTSTKFTVESVEHTKETYQTWLKRMAKEDPAFVEDILGKRKAELFRAGKLTLSRMAVVYVGVKLHCDLWPMQRNQRKCTYPRCRVHTSPPIELIIC